MKTTESKFSTVIEKNTFYFFNPVFEERYDGYLYSVTETLLNLKNSVETGGLHKELVEELLEKENGLTALLALTGFSNKYFKRLITIIRVADDPAFSKLALKEKWCSDELSGVVTEWSDDRIAKMLLQNQPFRQGIANIFFEGATVPFLANIIPLFELDELYTKIASEKVEQQTSTSRVGDVWVSFHLDEIITIRDKDWEALQPAFYTPKSAKAIDHTKIVLLANKNDYRMKSAETFAELQARLNQ